MKIYFVVIGNILVSVSKIRNFLFFTNFYFLILYAYLDHSLLDGVRCFLRLRTSNTKFH